MAGSAGSFLELSLEGGPAGVRAPTLTGRKHAHRGPKGVTQA